MAHPQARTAGIWPSGHVESLVLTLQSWAGATQEVPLLSSSIGPSSSSLSSPPTVASGPCARAHGVKSLPVSLCSKLFSKRGREWFSCYQHGFWALGNALPLLPAPVTKGPFVPLPAPLFTLFLSPQYTKSLIGGISDRISVLMIFNSLAGSCNALTTIPLPRECHVFYTDNLSLNYRHGV